MTTLKDIKEKLKLKVLACEPLLSGQIKGGYTGDMLSDVLAHSNEGDIWITVQVHMNILAVAAMKGHSAILVAYGKKMDEETLRKAEEEKVVVLSTELGSFEAGAKISKLLEKG
jgi:predicted transcriptional regulator